MRTLLVHGDEEGPRYRGFGRALIVSLVIHVIAVFGLSLYKYQESQKISLAPINMIELAEPGQTLHQKPAARRAAPPPPPPAPKIEAPAPKPLPKIAVKAPPAPPPVPIIPKKVEDSPPVRPAPKVEPKIEPKPKPPPQPEMTEAELRERLKKMREKVGDKMEGVGANRRTEADVRASIEAMKNRNPQPAQTAPAARVEAAAPKLEGPAGPVAIGTGVAKGTIVDMRFTAYRTRIWEHVKGRWTLLPSLAGRGLTAVIVATVNRSGTVTNCWIEGSSGVEAFDQSALRAVQTSSPLPEIPPDIPDSAFADGIGFRFTE